MRAPGKLSFAGLPPIRFDSHGSNTLHTEAPRQIALSCPTLYSKYQAQNGDCSSNARWGHTPSRARLAQSRALRLRKSKITRASFAATSMPAPPKHSTLAPTRTITFPKFSSSFAQPIGRRQSTKPSDSGSRDWGLRLASRARSPWRLLGMSCSAYFAPGQIGTKEIAPSVPNAPSPWKRCKPWWNGSTQFPADDLETLLARPRRLFAPILKNPVTPRHVAAVLRNS